MAFSKDYELEIDSTYRTSNSVSSSDFEYLLPYSFPTVQGQRKITLASAFIPESFYNIEQVQLYNYTGVAAGLSFIIPAQRYTAAQLASQMTAAAAIGFISAPTFTYSSTTGKFTITDTTATYPLALGVGVSPAFFNYLGFSGSAVQYDSANNQYYIQITAGSPSISNNFASMNFEREQRGYVRISNLDNKIMLPWLPTQIFTFGIPLLNVSDKGNYVYQAQDLRIAQTLYLNPNQLRANSLMKVQLVWQDGTVVNLNGRNWKISLRVET